MKAIVGPIRIVAAESTDAPEIRRAVASDVASVQSCARQAYAKYVERIGKEPAPMNADFVEQISAGRVYVAERDLEFLGYVVFFPEGDHIHLESVAVMPDCAGQGVGRDLINFAEQKARESGLVAIELYTNEAMTENLLMYPNLGYQETARKTQDGFRRVFFRKVL